MMSDHETGDGSDDHSHLPFFDELDPGCEVEEEVVDEHVLGGSQLASVTVVKKRRSAKPQIPIEITNGGEYFGPNIPRLKKCVYEIVSLKSIEVVKELEDILKPLHLNCLPSLFLSSCVEVVFNCYEERSVSVFVKSKNVTQKALVYNEKITDFSAQILSQILNLFRIDSVDEFVYDDCLRTYELSHQERQLEPLKTLLETVKTFLQDNEDGKNISKFLGFFSQTASSDIGRISTQGESKSSIIFQRRTSKKRFRKIKPKATEGSNSEYSDEDDSSSEDDDEDFQRQRDALKQRSDLISKLHHLADDLQNFLYLVFSIFVVNVIFPLREGLHYTACSKVGGAVNLSYKIKIDTSNKFPYFDWNNFDSEVLVVCQTLVYELKSFFFKFRRHKNELCSIKFFNHDLIKDVFSKMKTYVLSDAYGKSTYLDDICDKLFRNLEELISKEDIITKSPDEKPPSDKDGRSEVSSDSLELDFSMSGALRKRVESYVRKLKSIKPVKGIEVTHFNADDLLAIEASLRFLKKSPVKLSDALHVSANSAHLKVVSLLHGASQTRLEIPNIRNFTARSTRKQIKSSPRLSLTAAPGGLPVAPASDMEESAVAKRKTGLRMLQNLGITDIEESCAESDRPRREVKRRELYRPPVEPKVSKTSSVVKKEAFKRGLEIPGLSDFKEYDSKNPLRVVAAIGNTKLQKTNHGDNEFSMKTVPFYCEIKENCGNGFFRVSDYVGDVDPNDAQKSYIVHESLITELENPDVTVTRGALNSTRIPAHYFLRNHGLAAIFVNPLTKVQNVVGTYPLNNFWTPPQIKQKISNFPKPPFFSQEASAPNPTPSVGKRSRMNKALLQSETDQNTKVGEGVAGHSISYRTNPTNRMSSRISGVGRRGENIEGDVGKAPDEKAPSESSDDETSSQFTEALKIKFGSERMRIKRNLENTTSALTIDEGSFVIFYLRRMWALCEDPENFDQIQTKADLDKGGYKIVFRNKENARLEQDREVDSGDEDENQDDDCMSLDEQDFVYDKVMPASQTSYNTRSTTCVLDDHQKETQAQYPLNPRIKIFVFTASVDLKQTGKLENVIFIAPHHFYANLHYFRFIQGFLYGNGFMEPSQPFLDIVVQSDIETKRCIDTIRGFKFSEYDFKDWMHCFKIVGSEQSLLDKVQEFVELTYGNDARYTVKTMWTLCSLSSSPYCHGCDNCFLKIDEPLENLFFQNYSKMSGYFPRYCDLLYERPPCAGMQRGHRFYFNRPGYIEKVEAKPLVEGESDSVGHRDDGMEVYEAEAIEWPFDKSAAQVSVETFCSDEVDCASKSDNAPIVQEKKEARRSKRHGDVSSVPLSSESRAKRSRSEKPQEASDVKAPSVASSSIAPRERKTRSTRHVNESESELESEPLRRSTRVRR